MDTGLKHDGAANPAYPLSRLRRTLVRQDALLVGRIGATMDNPGTSPVALGPGECTAASGVRDPAIGDRSPWGWVTAILLFIYGAFPLLYGVVGLLFVPGLLAGGISMGPETTLLKILAWTVFHTAVTTHGCAAIAAALNSES